MLNNIQLLRALAAYGVVVFHLEGLAPGLLGRVGDVTVHGIDLFFVISGFIMVHIARRDAPSPGTFVANRIVRIVPLYWALTLALFALALAGPALLGAERGDWAGLAKSLFFIGYERRNGVVQPLVYPGWTLNYEMLFYALFALSLLLRTMGARVAAVGAVLVALVALGAVLRPDDPLARFYTSPRLLEFLFGMALGLAHPRIAAAPPAPVAALAVGVLGAAAIVLLELVPIGPVSLVLLGLAATAIVYAALALEARGRTCRNRALLLLGAASYSLYLTHVFAVGFVAAAVRRFEPPPGVALLVALAIATAVGIAVHLWFERPTTGWLRGRGRAEWSPGDSGGDKRVPGR